MSKIEKLLSAVGRICESDGEIAADIDTAAAEIPVNMEGELTDMLIGYLNDKFGGDFSVVNSAFDDGDYRLFVKFSPEIDAADSVSLTAELADIFSADPADVTVGTDSVEVQNVFSQEECYDNNDVDYESTMGEGMITKVIGGKVVKKLAPRPGYKVVDGAYVKMSREEIMSRKLAAKMMAIRMRGKKRKMSSKGKTSMKKSMALRAKMKLNK